LFRASKLEEIPVTHTHAGRSHNGFFILCSLLLVVGFLYWAQKVLVPVALAVLLAFILTPAVSALQRRGLRRVPSVLLVTILVFALLWGIGWIISQQITGLINHLPSYKGEVIHKIESLRGASESSLWIHIRDFFDSVTHQLVDPAAAGTTGEPQDVQPGLTPDRPLFVTTANSGLTRLWELAGPAGEFLVSVFLVVVLTVFMLTQREGLRNRLVRLMGHGQLVVTTRAIDEGARRISRYLLMQVFINASFALLLSVGLFLLGLYADLPDRPALRTTAVFWGFIAGSLRFVPYLGTWVAAGLLFIFTIGTLPGWSLPLVVLAYFLVLELLTANAVEPLLFGQSTGSSPLALLLAAAFWTWLWGPVGLLLSTPLTVILVVVGKYVPQFHFFEVLLGDEPALGKTQRYYQRLVAHDQDEASDLVEQYVLDHSVHEAITDVLLPALNRARRDRAREELDADSLQTIYRATRETLDEVAPAVTAEEATKERPHKADLVGCPASDEGEQLALEMFAVLLRPLAAQVEVLSANLLAAEILARIGNQCPAVVCIASLPPGGSAHARYLCKRIRAQCSTVKIVVARWGEEASSEQLTRRFKAAGADFVSTSLAQTRGQVAPLLQMAAVTASAFDPALANAR
jgi:predicted PurR-regulated permease PerM